MKRVVMYSKFNMLYALLERSDAFNKVPSYLVALSLLAKDNPAELANSIENTSNDWPYYRALFNDDLDIERISDEPHKNIRSGLISLAAALGRTETLKTLLNLNTHKTLSNPGIVELNEIVKKLWYIPPLYLAAKLDQRESIATLLEWGSELSHPEGGSIKATEPRYQFSIQDSPLHYAAASGHIELVTWLLEHGANVQAIDECGITIVGTAAYHGHNELVERLLEEHVREEDRSHAIREAFMNAIQEGHAPLVQWLIEYGRLAESAQYSKWSAEYLFIAIQLGYADVVRLLHRSGTSLIIRCEGLTALHMAAKAGNAEVVQYIDENCTADQIRKVDSNKLMTPLHFAAANGHLEVVKYLLNKGASFKSCDEDKATPLHLAAANGHLEVVKCLVDQKASLKSRNKDYATPLHLAARYGQADVVQHLVENGANLYAKSHEKDNVLHYAARAESGIAVARCLPEEDIRKLLSQANTYGDTPLSLAAEYGRTELIKYLLEIAPEIVDLADSNDITPLRIVVTSSRKPELVQLLLDYGADIEHKTSNGCSVLLDASVRWNPTEDPFTIAKLLLDHGADITSIEIEGHVHHRCVIRDHYALTQSLDTSIKNKNFVESLELLRTKCEGSEKEPYIFIHSTDNDKNTFLHRLMQHYDGSVAAQACVNELVSRGINPEEKNKDGKTALEMAQLKHHAALQNLLFPGERALNKIIDLSLIEKVLVNGYLPISACPATTYTDTNIFYLSPQDTVKLFIDDLILLFSNIESSLLNISDGNKVLNGLRTAYYTQKKDNEDWSIAFGSYTLSETESNNFYTMMCNLQMLNNFTIARTRVSSARTGMRSLSANETLETIKVSLNVCNYSENLAEIYSS